MSKLHVKSFKGKKPTYREAMPAEILLAGVEEVRAIWGSDAAQELNRFIFDLFTEARYHPLKKEERKPTDG